VSVSQISELKVSGAGFWFCLHILGAVTVSLCECVLLAALG
jgi:hypothetical protein